MKQRLWFLSMEYLFPAIMVIIIGGCIQFFLHQRTIILQKHHHHASFTHTQFTR